MYSAKKNFHNPFEQQQQQQQVNPFPLFSIPFSLTLSRDPIATPRALNIITSILLAVHFVIIKIHLLSKSLHQILLITVLLHLRVIRIISSQPTTIDQKNDLYLLLMCIRKEPVKACHNKNNN